MFYFIVKYMYVAGKGDFGFPAPKNSNLTQT